MFPQLPLSSIWPDKHFKFVCPNTLNSRRLKQLLTEWLRSQCPILPPKTSRPVKFRKRWIRWRKWRDWNLIECWYCRVGLRQPSTEVRFKDLYVETEVYADLTRNLPSVLGFYRGLVEVSRPSWLVTSCFLILSERKTGFVSCSQRKGLTLGVASW